MFPSPRATVRRVALPTGVSLELAEQGPADGVPVLMLHGITDSWRSFEPVLPHFSSRVRAIAVSQRGHGASDKPASDYRTRDFAADAAALIDALALPPVVVLGHSMGSSNAFRLAIDRPDLVRAVIGVGAFACYGDKADLAAFVAEAIEPLADPVPRALADEFQRSTINRPVPEALLQQMVEQSLLVPAAVWRAGFAGLMEDDFPAELPRITVPVLLLRGELDSYAGAADTAALRRAMPQAQDETWAGAGHAPHWEEPARFARSVERFVHALATPVGRADWADAASP